MDVFGRRAAAAAALSVPLALATYPVAMPVRADSPVQSVGIGATIASPLGGPSLLLKFNDRWTGGIAVGGRSGGAGAQVQISYSRKVSRGGYWTAGGGRATHTSVVRAGYGYAWQVNAFRLHIEATLNLPFNRRELQGLGGFAEGLAFAFPIGAGVHYVFGAR